MLWLCEVCGEALADGEHCCAWSVRRQVTVFSSDEIKDRWWERRIAHRSKDMVVTLRSRVRQIWLIQRHAEREGRRYDHVYFDESTWP